MIAESIQLSFHARIKIGITFIFVFHRRPIQLVVFVPVGLLSFLRHLLQVLLGVFELQPLTVQAGRQKKLRLPTRPAEDINILTKGLEERT